MILLPDVNECLDGTDLCSPFAECRNDEGSYVCVCMEGYTGDGRVCTGKCDFTELKADKKYMICAVYVYIKLSSFHIFLYRVWLCPTKT